MKGEGFGTRHTCRTASWGIFQGLGFRGGVDIRADYCRGTYGDNVNVGIVISYKNPLTLTHLR